MMREIILTKTKLADDSATGVAGDVLISGDQVAQADSPGGAEQPSVALAAGVRRRRIPVSQIRQARSHL